ncbi:MAG: type II CAAX endopeptidase family protein [Gemmatimonadota bacterium]|nr:type II CAAX endopeptidase family protein [Gemmatimonadota bacterium]
MRRIRPLLAHELRMLARDTRMLLIAFVLPLVVFPALILVMRAVERGEAERMEETVFTYAVSGEREDWTRALLLAALDEAEAAATDSAGPRMRFEERQVEQPDSLLAAEHLHVVVEGFGAADAPGVRLHYRASSDLSRAAASDLAERLERVRGARRDSALVAAGLPVPPDRVAEVVPRNIAGAEREGGALLGLALTPFVLLLMLTGGSIAAVDTLSGEKERGTLETLLTTGLARADIVRAKVLAIVLLGLVLVAVNTANLLVYLGLGVIELPEHLALSLTALDTLLVLLLLAPLTVLVASALLLLSGRVDGYKEFQIAFFPVLLVFVALSVAGMLPGMELRSAIAFVPVAGIGVAVREVVLSQHDWPFLLITWCATAGAGYGLTRLTERSLSAERLIGGGAVDPAELQGGPALFPRRVLRWFAVIWALFFTVSLWFGEALGIRGQVFVNLVVLFGGGTALMIRVYRLDPVRVLFLRAPPPAAWVAVLIGAPAAYLAGIGLAELIDAYVFPVPESVLESFGNVLLGDSLPMWQLLLFLAVLPGVFEEIAFRGVLLHGLSARLRPVTLCLVVGALFGLFHVALFRIVPTAFLGVLLAATVLLTGSVLPAMLWHALNNAIALVPAHLGWVDADTTAPGWAYVAAVAGLLLAFGILYATRRPPPGLGRPHPSDPRAAAAMS